MIFKVFYLVACLVVISFSDPDCAVETCPDSCDLVDAVCATSSNISCDGAFSNEATCKALKVVCVYTDGENECLAGEETVCPEYTNGDGKIICENLFYPQTVSKACVVTQNEVNVCEKIDGGESCGTDISNEVDCLKIDNVCVFKTTSMCAKKGTEGTCDGSSVDACLAENNPSIQWKEAIPAVCAGTGCPTDNFTAESCAAVSGCVFTPSVEAYCQLPEGHEPISNEQDCEEAARYCSWDSTSTCELAEGAPSGSTCPAEGTNELACITTSAVCKYSTSTAKSCTYDSGTTPTGDDCKVQGTDWADTDCTSQNYTVENSVACIYKGGETCKTNAGVNATGYNEGDGLAICTAIEDTAAGTCAYTAGTCSAYTDCSAPTKVACEEYTACEWAEDKCKSKKKDDDAALNILASVKLVVIALVGFLILLL